MSKGQLTRQRILEQAAPLFNKRGFRTAPLSEIMKVTGLQKGGIYNHFTSKEQLALETFDYVADLVRSRFPTASQNENLVETLKSSITRFRANRLNPSIAGGCPLLNCAVESDDAFPALKIRVIRLMRSWQLGIQKLVLEGLKRGEIRPGTDPQTVATIIISCLEGGVLLGRLESESEHMDRCCAHLLSYIESLRNT